MSQKQTLHFIRLVEERDVLWNRANPNYRDMHKQKRAWMEISSIVNIPTSSLIQKWKSLSGSYRGYNARVSQTAGSPNEFKPIWFAYNAMRFLGKIKRHPYIKRNFVRRKVLSNPQAQLPTTAPLAPAKDSPGTLSQLEPPSNQPSVPQPTTSETVNHTGPTKLLDDLMANEAETLELLKSLANPAVQPSSAAQFGLTVSGLVNHFSPEKRERLHKKIIETICNHDTFDKDVVSYGTTIMHLLQNMITSKRKSAYYGIVQLIVKCDTPD